jgi:hypothetical protein
MNTLFDIGNAPRASWINYVGDPFVIIRSAVIASDSSGMIAMTFAARVKTIAAYRPARRSHANAPC